MNTTPQKSLQEKKHDYVTQWLLEHDLATAMQPLPNTEDASPIHIHEDAVMPSIRPYDKELDKGQIRLFSSRVTGDTMRPLYFLVYSEWAETQWLMVPFGEYSVPCIPGEMDMKRNHSFTNVLCAWNARNMENSTLTQSWIVDQLNSSEQDQVRSMMRGALTGAPLPESLKERCGSPIHKPGDPRIDYQHQEIEWLDRIQDGQEWAQDDENLDDWSMQLPETIELFPARAAGDDLVTVLSGFVWQGGLDAFSQWCRTKDKREETVFTKLSAITRESAENLFHAIDPFMAVEDISHTDSDAATHPLADCPFLLFSRNSRRLMAKGEVIDDGQTAVVDHFGFLLEIPKLSEWFFVICSEE